jgi:signal transduction histidine kinase
MIYKLWFKIIAIIAIAALPIAFFGYHFQTNSLGVINNLHNTDDIAQIITDYAKAQKKLSDLDPTNSETYKINYQKTEKILEALSDIDIVSEPLISDLNQSFFLKISAILFFSIIVSFFVARSIVHRFNQLLNDAKLLEQKQLEAANLSHWQHIAKSLVHEIRAPIAPIKLVVSGIASKKETYSQEKFNDFILKASTMILEQLAYFEKMIENFTAFAKLPEPDLKIIDVQTIFNSLALKFGNEPDLSFEKNLPFASLSKTIAVDLNLIDRLIVNILRNSREANKAQGQHFKIRCQLSEAANRILLSLNNNGSPVPEGVVPILFSPKPPSSSGKNFGIGLLICKKIALSHEGDLSLTSNDVINGVTFTLSLPMKVST